MLTVRQLLAAVVVLACSPILPAAEVMYILNSEFDLTEGNEALLEIFDARGDSIEFWDNSLLQGDPEGALEAADAADLVFIDESVSSGRADAVIDTTTPVINNEQFAFDNWGMTGVVVGHGSPNRPNANGDELDGGSYFGTSIEIVDPMHPIAARAGASGLVQVYEDVGGRIDWGRPGPEANIVAQLPGFEEFQPASPIFVYEAGAELADGTTAPGMRIGFFISDTNRGPEPEDPDVPDDAADNTGEGREATLLTPDGIALLNAAIDYALGIVNPVLPGDFNMDGVLNVDDANMLGLASASGQNDVAFDLNADALVNDTDVTVWIKDLRNSWIGDANVDGEFNSGDLVQVFTAGKYEQLVETVWGEGDWNGDGRFDSGDLVAAFQDGGFEMGPRPAAAVPEPTSAWILLAAMGLMIRRRR